MKKYLSYLSILTIVGLIYSCSPDQGCTDPLALNYEPEADNDDGSCIYDEPIDPTLAQINIPQIFIQSLPAPYIPSNNPLTKEGIELGRKLFFDPILSGNGTQSCADCHSPQLAFTDTNQFSTGIDLLQGTRNSMPIFNMAWNYSEKFFNTYFR